MLKMSVSLVLAALLCFITWMSMAHATHGRVASCCPGWSNTRIPITRIINYAIQTEGVCPVKAIIFHTESGKRICSEPNTDWARRAIQKVDKERNKKALKGHGQKEKRLTRDITSTTRDTAPSMSTTRYITKATSTTGDTAPVVSTTRDTAPAMSSTRDTTQAMSSTRDTTQAMSTTRDSAPAMSTARETAPAMSTTRDTTQAMSTTRDTTPAMSTTSERVPQKNDRYGRRRRR